MRINLRNPATQKGIIIGALLFGVAYAYVDFVYLPRRELTATLVAEHKQESELLARGKRVAANYQTVQDDYARLMQSWDLAQELLPTQKEMEDLLKAVTLEGQRRDVSFLLFKPLDPIEKPYYWDNPIQVKTLLDVSRPRRIPFGGGLDGTHRQYQRPASQRVPHQQGARPVHGGGRIHGVDLYLQGTGYDSGRRCRAGQGWQKATAARNR